MFEIRVAIVRYVASDVRLSFRIAEVMPMSTTVIRRFLSLLLPCLLLLGPSLSLTVFAGGGSAIEELTLKLTIPNKGTPKTTDLHWVIENTKRFNWAGMTFPAIFDDVNRTKQGLFQGQIDYFFSDLDGQTRTFAVRTSSKENEFTLKSLKWSYSDGTKEVVDVKKIKMNVTPVGDPMSDLLFSNLSDSYVTFTGLSYLNDVADQDIFADIGSIGGFTPFESTLIIPPNSDGPHYIFPNITPGNYLYIEGSFYESDMFGDPIGDSYDFRFGHQSPLVPEPGSLLLLLLGALALPWRK
jgi:hypothetical protein